jgi:hypothetical protein
LPEEEARHFAEQKPQGMLREIIEFLVEGGDERDR